VISGWPQCDEAIGEAQESDGERLLQGSSQVLTGRYILGVLVA
jgi:hypothetical protein